MTRIERELIRAVLSRWLLLTAALSWIVFLIALSRALSAWGSAPLIDIVSDAFVKALSTLALTATITAPIAALLGVGRMRRTGVLACSMAAGFGPSGVVRALIAAAVVVVVCVAGAQRAWETAGELHNVDAVAEVDDAYVWSPAVAGRRSLVFRQGTLDVGLAEWRLEPSSGERHLVGDVRVLHGDPAVAPGNDLVIPAPGSPTLLSLAVLNRVAVGGVLLVLVGLLAVGVAERRWWLAPAGTVTLMAVTALLLQWTSVGLWLGGSRAVVAQGTLVVLTGAIGLALYVHLSRRGLRIE